MSLRFGRAGLDVVLREPASWGQDGADVTLSGLLADISWWELRALREQLLGYPSVDEPYALVRSDYIPELDGLYRVDKVQVAAPPGGFSSAILALPWQAQIHRLGNSQQAFSEDLYLASQLPHGHGTSPAQGIAYHFIPATTTVHQDGGLINMWNSFGGAGTTPRPSTDGDMTYGVCDFGAIGTTIVNTSLLWQVPYADFYRGDARVEFDYLNDGTGHRRVTGQNLLNYPSRVRLTNGIVRCTFGVGTFTVSHWSGSSWESSNSYKFSVSGGVTSAIDSWAAVSVLRNTPEEVSVRLVANMVSNTFLTYYADVTVKRGSRWVFVRTWATANSQWSMARTTGEAATYLSPGIHRTSNDTDGNRWIMASDYGVTAHLTNASLTTTTARASCLFGLGLELGGSGSVSPDTVAVQLREWYTAAQVVSRPTRL